jgi:hypothetical protein
VGKPEGKKLLGKSSRRQEDNIMMDLKRYKDVRVYWISWEIDESSGSPEYGRIC